MSLPLGKLWSELSVTAVLQQHADVPGSYPVTLQ